MEDPANEMEGVVRTLMEKPTLKRQEETLTKYFTDDVEFYHSFVNINTGLRALIVTYQMMHMLLNYSAVDFHNILYDKDNDSIVVRITVYVRPWRLLWHTTAVEFLVLFELANVVNGQKVKKIRVQRDYFIRSMPLLQLVPIVVEISNSDKLRFIYGNTQALVLNFIFGLVTLLFKSPLLWHGWLGPYSFETF